MPGQQHAQRQLRWPASTAILTGITSSAALLHLRCLTRCLRQQTGGGGGGHSKPITVPLARYALCSFAGCELLGGIGWLLSSWERLEALDLSGTAVDDADVELIGGCSCWMQLVGAAGGCSRWAPPVQLARFPTCVEADKLTQTKSAIAAVCCSSGGTACAPGALLSAADLRPQPHLMPSLSACLPTAAASCRLRSLNRSARGRIRGRALLALAASEDLRVRG